MGAGIMLSNTYHLWLRPGSDIVAKAGGLHKFTNWKGAILTDSGGFQVFSLAKPKDVKEDGVKCSSHIDGRKLFLTPEISMQVQNDLGAENAKLVDYKEASYADIKELCETSFSHTDLLKMGVKFADGVIVENNNVDPAIIECAKSLNLPVLDPVEGDAFKQAYSDFYETLF